MFNSNCSVNVHLEAGTSAEIHTHRLGTGSYTLGIDGVTFFGTKWQIEEILLNALNSLHETK